MKTLLRLAPLLAILAVPIAAEAQAKDPGAVSVQSSPSNLGACTPISATNAVNTVTTLTIPAPPYATWLVYICGIDLNVSNNATGAVVSTNLVFTSTNLGGWQYKYSAVNAANTNGLDKSFVWANPAHSAVPGTAVTIVSPAANAQASYTISAYYYYAP